MFIGLYIILSVLLDSGAVRQAERPVVYLQVHAPCHGGVLYSFFLILMECFLNFYEFFQS